MTKIDYIDPFINIAEVQARMAAIEEPKRLTLSDINRLTDSYDGDVYSDLYKDVYGIRPRGASFESVEAFDEDFRFLCRQLDETLKREAEEKNRAAAEFEIRLNEIMYLTNNMNREDAIRVLIQAEDIEKEVEWYGYERLEYELNLPYGYVKKTLQKDAA